MLRTLLLTGVGLLLLTGCSSISTKKPKTAVQGVRITPLQDRLRVEIDGQLFTEYFFTNVPRPYCYPVIGPGQSPMTRNWPMADPPNEEHDHPHHRSFWFAHGSINGHDFCPKKRTLEKQFTKLSPRLSPARNRG